MTRPVDRWFAAYADDHRHPTNQLLHVICVPAIVWSLFAVLHVLPTPAVLLEFVPGFGLFAAIAAAIAVGFWIRLSVALGVGSLVLSAAVIIANEGLLRTLGPVGLLWLAVAVFVLAWIGQFVGHRIEGRRPSFFTDLVYLLIGPPWVLAKGYRKLGLDW